MLIPTKFEPFFDDYGFIHNAVPLEVVENGSLFTLTYSILDENVLGGPWYDPNVFQLRDAQGVWHPTPIFTQLTDQGFSHDNMTAVLLYIFREHGRGYRDYSLWNWQLANPMNFFMYLWLRGYWWSSFFLFIPIIGFLMACFGDIGDTSGKQLFFDNLYMLKDHSWQLKLCWWLGNKILDWEYRVIPEQNHWVTIFKTYYPDSQGGEHPIVTLAKRVDWSKEY